MAEVYLNGVLRVMPYCLVTPMFQPDVRALCVKPYSGHPKGCPNFGRKETCPPKAPLLTRFFNLNKKTYAIYNVFNFGKHVKKMRRKHSDWTDRQLSCCLYWQPKARKQLESEIRRFQERHPKYTVVRCPEAMGCNVTATMKKIGVELEWPPRKVTVQVALAGIH